MAKLTATFENKQQVSRNSNKDYSHAYIVTVNKGSLIVRQGFASSREAAQKVAQREVADAIKNKFCVFVGGEPKLLEPMGLQWEVAEVVRS